MRRNGRRRPGALYITIPRKKVYKHASAEDVKSLVIGCEVDVCIKISIHSNGVDIND